MTVPVFRKLHQAVLNPRYALYRWIGHRNPAWLHRRQMRLAHRAGLKRAYFVLSFDCDTDWDAEVVESVHARLRALGICPVYAVPGALLEQAATPYGRLLADGAEFINHGYHVHSRIDRATRVYGSSHFYDRLSPGEIKEDIVRGHAACSRFLGKAPAGFRVPHFGSYQQREQLLYLHRQLTALGYQYSSSTTPYYGYLHGPVWRAYSRLYEFPVNGCYDEPYQILDSYSFRAACDRTHSPEDYLLQIRKWATWFSQPGAAGVFNIYADPLQVYDWPEFFTAMAALAPIACRSYLDVLRQVRDNSRP